MPRVDFYLLEPSVAQDAQRFACRLAEKAFKSGHSVYLHTPSGEQSQKLDDLLWYFREDSFVPHVLYAGITSNCSKLVQIGHEPQNAPNASVLINLNTEIPLFFNHFERIAEIVLADEANREAKRNSYKHYKGQGHPLHMHKIRSI